MRLPAGLVPIGCILLLAGCGSSGTPASSPATSEQSTTAAPAATAVSSPATNGQGQARSAAPAGFAAASVTFVSLREGWVLGSVPCASGLCPVLLRTQDGGRTWVAIPAPSSTVSTGPQTNGVREVRFADANDGWVYGPELWSTHDGGAHWTQQTLPGDRPNDPVQSLEVAAGTVHVLVLDVNNTRIRILSSPATHDAWTASTTTLPLGAGPVPQGQLVLQGSTGWAIEIDRTVVGGARRSGGAWTSWQPPCSSAGGFAALSAGTTTHLAAVCDEGTWTGPAESVHLYLSSNGGASFSRIAQAIGTLNNGSADAVTISSTGTIVVAGSSGSAPTGLLLASFNGGGSWATVYSGDSGIVADELGFTTASQGVAITDGAHPHLLMTYDGGHHWSAVTFA